MCVCVVLCVCLGGGKGVAMPCFGWSVASLSQWGPAFDLSPVHMEFVVDKVALGLVPLQDL